MSMPVEIRPYRIGDEEEIVGLLQSVFRGWPHFDLGRSSLDHWRWKYDDNPLRGKAVAVAESNHRIIGCSHGLYLKAKIGEKTSVLQQGTDLAILDDFRGMGIYPKMTAVKNQMHKVNNADYSFGLSNHPVVVRSYEKKVDPQFYLPLKHMIKIFDVDKHFRLNPGQDELLKLVGYKSLNALNKMRFFSGSSIKQPSFEISDRILTDKRLREFWAQIKGGYNFIIERDESFLNWRYRDGRGGRYTIRCAYENDELLGYIVFRVNTFDERYPKGYIVDLLTLPRRNDVGEALIRDADQFFSKLGVNIINVLAIQGHPHDRLLSKLGYLHDRNKLTVSLRSTVSEDYLEPLVKSPLHKLHFSYGDSDWI
jgi:hypothetical protein